MLKRKRQRRVIPPHQPLDLRPRPSAGASFLSRLGVFPSRARLSVRAGVREGECGDLVFSVCSSTHVPSCT